MFDFVFVCYIFFVISEVPLILFNFKSLYMVLILQDKHLSHFLSVDSKYRMKQNFKKRFQ